MSPERFSPASLIAVLGARSSLRPFAGATADTALRSRVANRLSEWTEEDLRVLLEAVAELSQLQEQHEIERHYDEQRVVEALTILRHQAPERLRARDRNEKDVEWATEVLMDDAPDRLADPLTWQKDRRI